MSSCPECGLAVEKGLKICGACGAKLAPRGEKRLTPAGWLECGLLFFGGIAEVCFGVFLMSWLGIFPRGMNGPIGWTSLLSGVAAIPSAFYLLDPRRSRRTRLRFAFVFFILIPAAVAAMFYLRTP
jgi:hypothetical protein